MGNKGNSMGNKSESLKANQNVHEIASKGRDIRKKALKCSGVNDRLMI